MEEKVIHKRPKLDLHRHSDGDVKPELLDALAEKDGIKMPFVGKDGALSYFKSLRKEGISSLLRNGFGLVTGLMQSKENLSIVAYEGVRNLAEDNIVYGEFRFAPQYHTGESVYYGHAGQSRGTHLDYVGAINAVADGLRKGERDFGARAALIVCIGREADPETGKKVVEAAIKCHDNGVVGIDLACDEFTYPPERHLHGYELTFNTPLKRTVHAGEMGDRKYVNILTAIKMLRADRLGHAITIAHYDDIIATASKESIGIEMCPESNIFCGFIKSRNELDIPKLLSSNVPVSVNSDDPAMFGYTLTQTLHRLTVECNLNAKHLKKLQLNAASTAFTEKAKPELIEIIEAAYTR